MNVHSLNSAYDFEILGASYIGKPRTQTVMFVSYKIQSQLVNLKDVSSCLVFVDDQVKVDSELRASHCFMVSDNPSREYAKVVSQLWEKRHSIERLRKYRLVDEGYYIGENTSIAPGVEIQPGCFIDHDVVIGSGSRILSGARISNAILGNDCIVKQNAVIGGYGFVMSKDEQGNNIRIPSMGSVVIGDDVEIGSFTTVCRGTGNDTRINKHVKIDDHVHIGHDVTIDDNCEITAGSIIGGYCFLGKNSFVGINSTLRNRIMIGEKAIIGMGSVVTKSFSAGVTIIGNPAHIMEKKNGIS